jgi:hypothetical protein
MKMTIEKDIKDFADRGDFLETMRRAQELKPITVMTHELMERSAMYIEFLAAAFLKETGLNASEAELVCTQQYDYETDKIKVVWYFRKRD